MVSFGQVKAREFQLIEPGEYVLTLDDIEESEGNWGDRLVWKFLVAPTSDPTNYISFDGTSPRTLWAFSDADIILGSLNHEFIEKLSGRSFGEGDEPPNTDDLLGKRVLAYITHHTPKQGKSAGQKREQIVPGSIKSYRLPHPNANGAKAPPAVLLDADGQDVDRDLLVGTLTKQVAKLKRLDQGAGADAEKAVKASDLNEASLPDIQDLLDQVNASIAAALDN